MSNEQKNSRTVIEDLPVAEKELTTEEMEKVEGGKAYYESRSNTAKTEAAPPVTGIAPKEPPVTPKTSTPL